MKIINLVLGLGTAIILASLISMGASTFYPAPEYPEYPGSNDPGRTFNCDFNDFKCLDEEQTYYDKQDRERADQQEEYDEQLKEYDEKNEAYGRNLFVITNITGLLVFLGGLLMLSVSTIATRSIAVGVVVAGLLSIAGGYADSWWTGASDKTEFVVGLLVAIIVIAASMWFAQQYHRKNAQLGGQS